MENKDHDTIVKLAVERHHDVMAADARDITCHWGSFGQYTGEFLWNKNADDLIPVKYKYYPQFSETGQLEEERYPAIFIDGLNQLVRL